MKQFAAIVVILVIGLTLQASPPPKVATEVVEYRHGDVVLEGFLAYPFVATTKRPGILVVHEWGGLGSYAKKRAEKLAQLGYVAFAIDMYGKGVHPESVEDKIKQVTIYKFDRKLMRARAEAGLDVLRSSKLVDPHRIAAIGYCFGGTVALELARSGADLAGVVSFHGGLDTPDLNDAKNIKGKILVLHGADDPNVPPEQVSAFEEEMRKAKVDWQLIKYGGAVHAFTNPDAGSDPSKGAAYNHNADLRSWEAMEAFFGEIFR